MATAEPAGTIPFDYPALWKTSGAANVIVRHRDLRSPACAENAITADNVGGYALMPNTHHVQHERY